MKTTKKALSVLLAVVMLFSTTSVCFSSLAAPTGTVSDAQWNALADSLKNTTVADAAFKGSANNYEVNDPDGKIITAVEAYWTVFNLLSDKSPSSSSAGNRTINMVNSSIKSKLQEIMGSDYTVYKTESFLTSLMAGANVTADKGGDIKLESNSAPGTNLPALNSINVTVKLNSSILSYVSIDDLPDKVAASKTFTVNHSNDRYDTYSNSEGSGCNKKTYYHFEYYYYISSVTSADGAMFDTSELKTYLQTLRNNEAVFTDDIDALCAMGAGSLTKAKSEIVSAYNSVLDVFSSEVWNHFYSDYNVISASNNIDLALNILNAQPIADDIVELCKTDYSDFGYDQLNELYNTLKAKIAALEAYPNNVIDYFASKGYSIPEAKAYLMAVEKELQLIEIREYKKAVDSHLSEYEPYTEEMISDGSLTSSEITAAAAVIKADKEKLSSYYPEYVAEVCGEGYMTAVNEMVTKLTYLGSVAGYNDRFVSEYQKFASEIKTAVDITSDSESLLAVLKNYDSWYSGLKALTDEMKAQLGEETASLLLSTLNDEMVNFMDSAYDALYIRVKTQIDDAANIYEEIKKQYGEVVSMASIDSYKLLVTSIGLIDNASYNYLLSETSNFDKMDEETIRKYEALKNVVVSYEEFKKSYGFSSYVPTVLEEIVRHESDGDIAREGDYTVTDEKVEKIIDLLEEVLSNEKIKALLGFDLGEILNGALDSIYSDNVINAIIQYVYPAVGKEFAKVWAGLPDSITIPGVETGVGSLKADVVSDLFIDDVEKAIASVGISTFPVQLGNLIEKNYPAFSDAAKMLQSVTTKALYNNTDSSYIDPWNDEALYTVNENGDKVLNISWGVKDRESFIDAAVAALSGLEPLLLAILSNISYNNNESMPESTDYRGSKIGTGKGTAKVSFITLQLTIDPISLVFMCSANDGYDNALAPIFEALGLENIPHGEELTSTRAILEKGLFGMIDQLFEKIANNPLKTILDAIPNIAYALEGDMVTNLLSMLKTDISYTADAKYDAQVTKGAMKDAMHSDEPIKVDLSSMIDLKSLGVDISSFKAVWDMVMGLLKMALPCPSAGALATMGELTWKDTNRSAKTYSYGEDGKAAYIVANRADLLIYLVRYVLSNDIISKFIDKEAVSEILADILDNIAKDPDLTISAVVELLNQVKYDTFENYTWYDGSVGGTVDGLTPAKDVYLSYNNNWTKGAADYITENINEIITSVLKTAGLDFDLSAEFKNLIDKLFTNETITSLAKALSGISLDEKLSDALIEVVGIDLSTFAQYKDIDENKNWGFEDGDTDGFVKALLDVISPFDKLVAYLLDGENIDILNGGAVLLGYDGFDSAIIPLLEAFGCDIETSKSGIENTLDSLLNKIADIEKDPVNGILDIIPGVIYYLSSNALSTGIRNLLQGVYVILDTIRPIYDLDLNALLSSLTKDLGFNINLDDMGTGFLCELISGLTSLDFEGLSTLIYDVSKVIGVDYTSKSTLIGAAGKKGAYVKDFDKADMVTVIISYLVDWLKKGDNAAALDELLGTNGIINSVLSVFEGTNPDTKKINWMYYFGEDTDFSQYDFSSGVSIEPTINSLTYPNNWTEETAKYVDDNLADIEKTIVNLIDKNYDSLGDLLKNSVKIYTTENVQAIADALSKLLSSVDTTLLETAGILLGADLNALASYKAPAGITTGDEFASALADILSYVDGLVNWLFFGQDYKFFKSADGSDAINIYGAKGYKNGLASVLEALDVKNLPITEDESTVEEVLKSLFKRVDEILANPVSEVLDILPNVIYFLNADGLTASVYNLLSPVYALLKSLEPLGVKLDISELIGFDLNNLSTEKLMELAQNALGLNLAPVANILSDLCVGTIKAYDSIGDEYAYKMVYDSVFARYDMITIIATVLLETISIEENEEPLKKLVGEEIYGVIMNFFDMYEVPMQDISYINTEYADTDHVFSALFSSELYEGFTYGPMFTRDKAQYIADNIGDFIDNVIYLLGIKIDGKNVNTLTELLNELINGSLYNSKNAAAVVDMIRGLVKDLEAMNGGKHILAVLKTSLGVDLYKYNTMTFEEFDNDRAKFENAIIEIAKPVYPLLKWLLSDEDISFFVDESGKDMITLKGAEGYAYGIIPLLEVIDCKNIMTVNEYYSAVAKDENVLISSILTPLLNRLDVIIENPAEEILAMLPNLIYFINSNGVDTVVKNTLNAVYTVLNAIEPIAKIDLYELIGIDLSTLTFEKLLMMLVDLIDEKTGYKFDTFSINSVAELSVGKLVSYTSANGKTAYKMVYQSATASAEMVTVVMRLLVTFIMHENNINVLMGILKDNFAMSPDAEKYVRGVLEAIADCAVNTQSGMDKALGMIYYVYYGLDYGAGGAANGIKDLNAKWQQILKKLGKSDDPNEASVGNLIAGILDIVLEDIFTSEGLAPNGFIAFFQKIAAFFQKIIDFFKNIGK